MNYKLTKRQILEVVENRLKMNDVLIDEAYPESFNIETFKNLKSFNERINYCNQHLQKIGAGSSRIVFKVDNDMVLKLAKNNKGVAQNESEFDIFKTAYYSGGLAAEVFEVDDRYLWIEMELAQKCKPSMFKQIVGVDFDTFGRYVMNYDFEMKGKRTPYRIEPNDEDIIANSDFCMDIINLMLETNLAAGDLIRISSYGVVNRDGENQIVLIDYGATDDIISTYYSRK